MNFRRARRLRRRVVLRLTLALAASLALMAPPLVRSDATAGRRGASPAADVTVEMRDEGCTLSATSVADLATFHITNRGRASHRFSVDGRAVRVASGRTAVRRVSFFRGGRHTYSCSRGKGRAPLTGQFVVFSSGAGTPTATRPCGVAQAGPATYRHVIWIVLENKAYSQIIGSAEAQYLNLLADKCGLATKFSAETHPSLPNYIAMTSGGTQDITDDHGPYTHPLAVDSIFSQVGDDWRALEESMPANCSLGNDGDYLARHNPAVYYTGIRSSCATKDVPLGERPDLSARFTFVTPNACHDMHSSSCGSGTSTEVHNGDSWLATFLPKVFASAEYRSGTTAVFVTWDEDDYSDTNAQHVPTLVIAPSVRAGTRSATRFDHYSLLRTTEELLGLDRFLGAASAASSMRRAFHL